MSTTPTRPDDWRLDSKVTIPTGRLLPQRTSQIEAGPFAGVLMSSWVRAEHVVAVTGAWDAPRSTRTRRISPCPASHSETLESMADTTSRSCQDPICRTGEPTSNAARRSARATLHVVTVPVELAECLAQPGQSTLTQTGASMTSYRLPKQYRMAVWDRGNVHLWLACHT